MTDDEFRLIAESLAIQVYKSYVESGDPVPEVYTVPRDAEGRVTGQIGDVDPAEAQRILEMMEWYARKKWAELRKQFG